MATFVDEFSMAFSQKHNTFDWCREAGDRARFFIYADKLLLTHCFMNCYEDRFMILASWISISARIGYA